MAQHDHNIISSHEVQVDSEGTLFLHVKDLGFLFYNSAPQNILSGKYWV